MKKNVKVWIILALTFGFLFLLTTSARAASSYQFKKVDYQAQLQENGDMKVTETWHVAIDEVNTLFKTFNENDQKITDVEVSELKDGQKIPFNKISTYMYHVTKGSYYGLMNSDGKFEIAFGVSVQNEDKTYEISYTVKNAVTNYTDCSQLYWQFLGKEVNSTIGQVTGTITLPSAVSQKEDLKVWAHGPLNGIIQIASNDKVNFEVASLKPNTYVEVRLAMPKQLFPSNTNVISQNYLNTILAEEKENADKANQQRDKQKMLKTLQYAIQIVVAIILLYLAYRYYKKLKTIAKIQPSEEIKYYREIPNEKEATPGNAAFLYYGVNGTEQAMPKILSATMLDFALKKYITFEILEGKSKKKNTLVRFSEKVPAVGELKNQQQIIYDLLEKIAKESEGNDSKSFTMKDFEKYARLHHNEFLIELGHVKQEIEKDQIEQGNFEYQKKETNKWGVAVTIYAILAVITLFFFFWIVTIVASINLVLAIILCGKYRRLTQKGGEEREQWKGLKRFMDDFSLLKDKEIPQLILWEKYLVYATVFGTAEKVLKQLKVVYSEFSDQSFMASTTYLYLMTDMNFSFLNTMNNACSTAYQSVDSSASGSGGGFSGGGGFGGGRRWHGRKIKTPSDT